MEKQNDVVFSKDEVKQIVGAIRAEQKGKTTILDLCQGHGLTGEDLKSGGKAFEEIQTAVAAGLLSKPDFKLWYDGAESAKAIGQSDARNALSKLISAYVGALRRDLNNRLGIKPEKRQKAAGTADTDSAGEGNKSDTLDQAGESFNPAESLENFLRGINVMIIAANNSSDKVIHKHRSTVIAGLQSIIGLLNK
jgi:hypothetical protein